VCCGTKIDEKCETAGQSRLNNLQHNYDWSIPSPYIDWSKTEPVLEKQIPVGVKIKFRVRINIIVSADVTCLSCGKPTRFRGLTVAVRRHLLVPFKLVGQEYARFSGGGVIPGINPAILALEVAELRETAEDVKSTVENFVQKVRTTKELFTCTATGIDRNGTAAKIAPHASRKRELSEEEFVVSAESEEALLAMFGDFADVDEVVIELPEEEIALDSDETDLNYEDSFVVADFDDE